MSASVAAGRERGANERAVGAVALGALLVAVMLAACGGPGKGTRQATRAPTAIERAYPVLRLVPEEVSYALVARRVADAITVARELLALNSLAIGFDLSGLERQIPGSGGRDLDGVAAQAGIDLQASAALFGDPEPVLLLPVADQELLARFLQARQPEGGVTVRRYRGHDWYTWHPGGAVALDWVILDGYLAVHLGPGPAGLSGDQAGAPRGDAGPPRWLDAVLEDSPRLGEGQALVQAMEATTARLAASAPLQVIGLVRPARLREALARSLPQGAGSVAADCLQPTAALAGTVALGVAVEDARARAAVLAELVPGAAAELDAHVTAPPPGFARYAARAGLYAGLATDIAWLERLVRERVACPLVPELASLSALPAGLVAGGFVAIESVNPDELTGRGAVHLGLGRGSAWVEGLLDQVPRRSLFERTVTVAGQRAKEISVPFFVTARYLLTDTSVTAAMGEGVLAQVLSGPAPAGAREVAGLMLAPARMPNLPAVVDTLIDAGMLEPELARSTAGMLMGYESLLVRLGLDGTRLALDVDVQRRVQRRR